jgi:transcriptional regulator with XRE-family HTH domain
MKISRSSLNRAGETVIMSPGEMVRTLRELKGWSQNRLAKLSKISQANISGIENNRIQLGKSRAIALAKVLHIHPGSIMFADYLVAV